MYINLSKRVGKKTVNINSMDESFFFKLYTFVWCQACISCTTNNEKEKWERKRGEKKVKGNGKEDRSQEQDDRFMGEQCDVGRDSVRCPQIQVQAQLLPLGKLNALRLSLLMC